MQRSFRIYEKRTNHSRDGEFKRVHIKRVYMYLSVFNRESGRERGAEDLKWATTPAATTALAKTCSIRLTLLHTRSHTIHNFLLSSMSLCVPSIHPFRWYATVTECVSWLSALAPTLTHALVLSSTEIPAVDILVCFFFCSGTT